MNLTINLYSGVILVKLNELLTISPGFHRSVNIKYDLSNPDKVASFIPTEKSELVFEHVLSALKGTVEDGASMLIGSYGTGKSHLATVLGSLFGKCVDSTKFDPVVTKIIKKEVKDLLLEELQKNSPYLLIPISGGVGLSLNQQLLASLKRALVENGLSFTIDSSFTTAMNCINTWSEDFPDTLESLKTILAEISFGTVDSLMQRLNDFEPEALEAFVRIYPKLAAGASFDYFSGDVADIYQSVCFELNKHGYRGIFIIFDEFNKVMDASRSDSSTLKTLQDLAELASRSDDIFKLHLLLISHRTIGQYLPLMTSALAEEWQKIEGRFKVFDVSNKSWETYDLISRVIHKKDPRFFSILTKENVKIEKISDHRRLKNLFEGLSDQIRNDVIIKGCLPLHPVTVFILPRVSAKLAQNERTLFTFLAGHDESPILSALSRDVNDFEYITPWQVYDYFEHQLSCAQDENLKMIWTKVTNALESLPSDAISEAKFVKTIGIFQVAGNSINLPCTTEMIEYVIGNDDYKVARQSLQERKLIYVRQSTLEIEIVEPADFDVEGEIKLWLQQKPMGVSALSYVEELGIRHYFYPHRYNHKYKITRYLTPVYANIENVQTIISNGTLSPIYDGNDGVICYLFPETKEEMKELSQIALNCNDKRVFIAISAEPFPIRETIWRLMALNDIKRSFEMRSVDSRVQALVDIYYEDARQDLINKIERITVYSNKILYFWDGTQIKIKGSERELSFDVSNMLEKVYHATPIINNELINKNNPTLTSRRARNDVIDVILKGYKDIRPRLRSSQEAFMFDTVFIETGLFNEESCIFTARSNGLEPTLVTMEEYFLDTKTEAKGFDVLIKKLIKPPFGIRRGIIPVLLAACVDKYKQYITIRDAAGVDCHIDASLLDKIVQAPSDYSLKIDDWNEASEQLTTGLAELFGWELPENIFFANKFGELADEVFRWFTGLPRFTRETNSVSHAARTFRRFTRVANRNPKQILLQDLPKDLGFNEYSVDDVSTLLGVIKTSKEELENALTTLTERVNSKLYEFFSTYGVPGESLISLARNMSEAMLKSKLPSLEWANIVDYISGFDGYDEFKFTHSFTQILTGVRLEDWLDKTVIDFDTLISELMNSFQQVAATDVGGPRAEVLFLDSAYDKEKYTLYECELSDLGKTLQTYIESSIENFSDAISPLEKRQILLNLLRGHI